MNKIYAYKIKVFNKSNPCECVRVAYAKTKREMGRYVAHYVDHKTEECWVKKLVK